MNKQTLRYIGFAAILAIVAVSAYFISTNVISIAEAAGCTLNPENDLVGELTATGTVKITNKSSNCSYSVGLASYKKFDENIDNQVLFDNESRTIKPNETITLTVDTPACAYQIDAFYGSLITSFKGGVRYGTRLLDWAYGNGNNYCKTTVPIPSPTISATCSAITVSWEKAGQGSRGYTLDITSENDFNNGGWHKTVTYSETPTSYTFSNFDAFSGFGGKSGKLAFERGKTYKVRIFYRATGKHSPVVSLTIPNNCTQPAEFTAACSANPSSVTTGQTVTWTATASGGSGSYTYSWGGNGVSGTSSTATSSYSTTGTKQARVDVTSGTQTLRRYCEVTVTPIPTPPNGDHLEGTCSASPQSAHIGNTILWVATANSSSGSISYSWSGTDGLSGTSATVAKSYTYDGAKDGTVTITSGNKSISRTCSVSIVPHSGGGGGGGGYTPTYTPPTTTPVVAGIYLSEVPYTGIGSNVKIALFMLGLLVWSAGIAYFLVRRRAVKGGMTMAELFRNTSLNPNLALAGANVRSEDRAALQERIVALKEKMNYRAIPIVSNAPKHDIALTEYQPVVNSPRPAAHPASLAMPRFQPTAPANIPTEFSLEQAEETVVTNAESTVVSLEARARELSTIVSADALETIAKVSNNNKHEASIILDHLVVMHKEAEHEAGDWLVLNSEKVNNALFTPFAAMTTAFIEWLANGHEKKAFAYLRVLQLRGQSVADFVSMIVIELDRVHKSRTNGKIGAATQVHEVTRHLSDADLEHMIQTLVHGVDQTHSSVYPSVKNAVISIFEAAKVRNQAFA